MRAVCSCGRSSSTICAVRDRRHRDVGRDGEPAVDEALLDLLDEVAGVEDDLVALDA